MIGPAGTFAAPKNISDAEEDELNKKESFGLARVKREGTTTPATKFITWHAEITDTFGGEANYSWVKRYEQTLPIIASTRAIVQHFKKLMGYTGVQCKRAEFGDVIELRPYKECVVIFISPEY